MFLPRQVPHTWTQRTDAGKLACSLQPAGRRQDFFRARPKKATPPTAALGKELFGQHGLKPLGPSLPVKPQEPLPQQGSASFNETVGR